MQSSLISGLIIGPVGWERWNYQVGEGAPCMCVCVSEGEIVYIRLLTYFLTLSTSHIRFSIVSCGADKTDKPTRP